MKAGNFVTAQVDARAEIAEDVVIGAFCVVGPGVKLGRGVRLHAHVALDGEVDVGENAQIHPFARIGGPGQIRGHQGGAGRVVIGRRAVVREHATINAGALSEDKTTRVGADALIMTGAHVGHDCRLGDRVTLVNNAVLGGHVEVGDDVMIGGQSAVHQRCRIGAGAFVAGMCGVWADVVPNGFAIGDRARLEGLNVVGMKRRGWDKARILNLRRIHSHLFEGPGVFADRAACLRTTFGEDDDVSALAAFLEGGGGRPILHPLRGRTPKG